jgi:MHS family shikimate/dehydroshikimate transporter-like MFS transporter
VGPNPDDPTGPGPRRVAIASAVGATIEWYDFFLYGTAAGLAFDKLYFNGLDGPAAQFAGFGTFAVGFVARPVGGWSPAAPAAHYQRLPGR